MLRFALVIDRDIDPLEGTKPKRPLQTYLQHKS